MHLPVIQTTRLPLCRYWISVDIDAPNPMSRPIGYGRTEKQAVRDLIKRMEERT